MCIDILEILSSPGTYISSKKSSNFVVGGLSRTGVTTVLFNFQPQIHVHIGLVSLNDKNSSSSFWTYSCHLYLDKKNSLWTLLFDICYHAKLKICGNDVRNTELKSRAFWNTATNDNFFVVGRNIEYWFTWFFKTLLYFFKNVLF